MWLKMSPIKLDHYSFNSFHIDMTEGPPLYFNSIRVEIISPSSWKGKELFLTFKNKVPIHNNQKIKVNDDFYYKVVVTEQFKYQLHWLNEI